MPVLLSFEALSKAYHHRPLFDDLSIALASDERTGLVGPNGSGKSTLLRILVGEEKADGGAVSLRKGTRLAYVPQADTFEDGIRVEKALADALRQESLEPYELQTRVNVMMGKAGFRDGSQAVSTLSGGWKKRLALSQAIIQEPDLLLMDEPTNHLDLGGILWLERMLKNAPFAFLLVSHDRYFLENVTNRVIELNRAYPEGFLAVNGTYSDYLVTKEEFLASQAHQEISLASKVRREVAWLQRGARARTTKSIHRIAEAGRMIDDLGELRIRNSQTKTVDIDFDATRRRTKELIATKGIAKSLGGKMLFHKLSLVLSPGTRMGLVGPNGSGKTTLLRVLAREADPDAGSIRHADGLSVVVFDQAREQLDQSTTLRMALADQGDTVVYRDRPIHVSAWANRFLFHSEQLEMSVSQLSGGEQARILIARLMLRPADVLILDEPTNDLDIPSMEVLEESLVEFPGAVVLVTHDRYMMDRVSTEILALDGKGEARFFADFDQWESHWGQTIEPTSSRPTASKAGGKPPGAAQPGATQPGSAQPGSAQARRPALRDAGKGFTVKEQKELDRMESRILAAEQDIEARLREMQDPAVLSDHIRLHACSEALQTSQEKLEGLYERWQELEQKKAEADSG